MIPKLKEGYAIQEALDNLGVIAGIDLDHIAITVVIASRCHRDHTTIGGINGCAFTCGNYGAI